MTPPSPCISLCRMNSDTNQCEGCARTLDEIALWSSADDDQKRVILAAIARRQQQGSQQ
ncbi:DUF1289 domain-containing protein [Glaciimonas sp. GG7]